MSDQGRKDFTTKMKEKITPDSSKSTYDKTKEDTTDLADKAQAEFQSDSSKGTTQAAFDKGKREKEGGFIDSVKVHYRFQLVLIVGHPWHES
jgi:Heat shock protein 9/12